jgi:hypothetical protein
MVEENLERGVNYLYVVPSDCANLSALRDLMRAFQAETEGKAAGAVRILRVDAEATREDWRFIDHVLMMVGKETPPALPSSFSGVFPHDIKHCFEQIYRPGDLVRGEGDRVWIRTPPRRIRLFLDLLRRWEPHGTWE